MNPIRKGLAVAVILLFIGLAFAPSINANLGKEKLVEFTTEICGLNDGKQTVKLTQQQANEVEAMFNSIREKLNNTQSREEAEEIIRFLESNAKNLFGNVEKFLYHLTMDPITLSRSTKQISIQKPEELQGVILLPFFIPLLVSAVHEEAKDADAP